MVFSSLIFLLFAAAFFAVWPLVRGRRTPALLWITAMSLVFYGWWDWRFLLLLFGCVWINHVAAIAMVAWPRWRKATLIVCIAANLGILGTFKYLDFLIGSFNSVAGAVGIELPVEPVGIILPVGLSFFTFQAMSYTIDVYRGQMAPARSLLQLMAYVSMFPQLVAGPIVRAADLLPQLDLPPRSDPAERWAGTMLIVSGFFKKVVVADNLAPVVDGAFAASAVQPDTLYWWLVVSLFAMQIYCDFSGYSDIARGLANHMGYHFPRNFNHPYIAHGFRDFWSRWHISLSTWFRDYVYIPLGGSRASPLRAHVNLWITMLLSGLWHGAAWTFVLWGAIHAACLSFERVTRFSSLAERGVLGRVACSAFTLAMVWLAWVFFRAETIWKGADICKAMLVPSAPIAELWSGLLTNHRLALLWFAVMVGREAWLAVNRPTERVERPPPATWPRVALAATILTLCVYFRGPGNAFIYFQF